MRRRLSVKPGKAPSAMGFIVGLAFVFIGIVVVIPSAGVFGLLWTGVAAAICVMHGINLFSKKGISTHEVIMDDTDRSAAQRLEEVHALYQQGLITQEEYESKRKELLDQL